MIISVHQPQYLPWLGFFDKIIKSDCFVFLDKVQYKQREFQNRNKIRTKDGWIWLTVPIVSKAQGRKSIDEIKIDNESDWQEHHSKSLQAWYGKAKYFDNYANFIEDVYVSGKWEKLVDLNTHIIKFILKEFQIDKPIHFESEIGTTKLSTDRIIEICKKLNADTYLSGAGGKDYLDEDKFKQEGISLRYQHFDHPKYQQMFMKDKDDFLPYMSAIDLLFNEGPNSRQILEGRKQ